MGVTCAFQVTSRWVSYSSLNARSAWRAPARGWPGSGGQRGVALGQAHQCPLYSALALSPFSSLMARMRSRSLISCTPQYVMNQMDKVLTGKPGRWRETWSPRCGCLPSGASFSPALLPLRWVWEVPQVHGQHHFPLWIQPYSFTERGEQPPGADFR